MNRTWTNSELQILKGNYHKMITRKLAPLLPGKTLKAIKTKAKLLDLKKDKGLPRSLYWNQKTDEWLIKLYPSHTRKEIAKIMGLTFYQVSNRAHKLGLHKKENTGRFKKGQVPPNKGKKMSPEIYEKVKHTFFKKGHTPKNHKPTGSIRITKDGYCEIKTVEPNKWDLIHRVIWKQSFGKINKGEVIIFKDGNKANISIDNLKKISWKENCARTRETDGYIANTIERNPEKRARILEHPELIELKRSLLKLKRTMKNGKQEN